MLKKVARSINSALKQPSPELIDLQTKFKIYDFLHRGIARICIGITVVGHIYLGYRAVRYYAFDRAILRKQELQRIKEAVELDEKMGL